VRRLKAFIIGEEYVSKVIPPRKKQSHKRMNGTVCVVGGSRLYHGAPFLCASGAIRAGVDLVFVAVPAVIATPVRALSPDFIVVPLPDSKLTRGNVTKLLAWVKDVDCFAVGPGLGAQNAEDVASAVNRLKGESKGLVVDADALRPQTLGSIRNSRTVVTPHIREFERLFGSKLPPDLDARKEAVERAASENGITVLLKAPTDVVSDGRSTGLNEAHTPAMTVGGTGDVLTGITAGLLSKGIAPFEAACAAAYVNGSAGAEAAKAMGLHITPSDVAAHIPSVMKGFDRLE